MNGKLLHTLDIIIKLIKGVVKGVDVHYLTGSDIVLISVRDQRPPTKNVMNNKKRQKLLEQQNAGQPLPSTIPA